MNKKPTYDQLQKKIETLENKINKYEHDFKTNKKKIKNLSEAVKELNCLYGISSLTAGYNWHYPIIHAVLC